MEPLLFSFFVKKWFYRQFFIVYKEFFVTLQTVHYKEFSSPILKWDN